MSHLSIHPSIYLSIHLSIHPSIHPSIHLSIYGVFELGLSRPLAGGGPEGSRGVRGGLDGDRGNVPSWPSGALLILGGSSHLVILVIASLLSRVIRFISG